MGGWVFNWLFLFRKGVRQRAPFFGCNLFLVALKLLAHEVRRDNIRKGIHFGEHEIRQVLYADDFFFFFGKTQNQ